MTKTSIALTELVEKGADQDSLCDLVSNDTQFYAIRRHPDLRTTVRGV